MQYIKLGKLMIPYKVTMSGTTKNLQIGKIKIPYSTYQENEKKYYKIFGISFSLNLERRLNGTSRRYHYQLRNDMDENMMKKSAAEIFKEKVGYQPDFENPRSFNEKIFWMKFNYHDPLVTKCCDKFAVKEYVTEKLGPGKVIPVIKSWESADQIDFEELPNQFALKVNWCSGYNFIIKDKTAIDEKAICEKIDYWMEPQNNSYYQAFNWGYKDMKPVVYAEEYMEQVDGQLYDYKFFCCNGKVKFWLIATDRYGEKTLTDDFFDMDFNKMEFTRGNRARSEKQLQKPKYYEKMIEYSEILSKPFPFVRVDFYEANDQIYVGEMTFYSGGGIVPFHPREWDFKLGEMIELPEKRKAVTEQA